MTGATRGPAGWAGILRLTLVQATLGAVVVLATTVMNRVMTVELALPAILPGTLVGLHYAVQLVRPRVGHASDRTRRRVPLILGGMALLGGGAVVVALAIAWMKVRLLSGLGLALFGYGLIGLGVGAAGTALLTLLSERVPPARRAAAATLAWFMMIAGFALSTALVGRYLDPFTPGRLIAATATVAVVALLLTGVAVWRIEPGAAEGPAAAPPPAPFRLALAAAWADRTVRRVTLFVFVAMLAYSAQELLLDPFAGRVLGLSPGGSTRLDAWQHGGALIGMTLVALTGGGRIARHRPGALPAWVAGGCLASAVALAALLVLAGGIAASLPTMRLCWLGLGLGNGAFAAAAIGSMLMLAQAGGSDGAGLRMGLFGAAQAIGFATGDLAAGAGIGLAHLFTGAAATGYAAAFAAAAALFLFAAILAAGMRAKPAALITRLGIAAGPRPG
ncbi:MAG TPA: PucC family protein [Acetobacteraceae bacterium]|nr:PucC family protein [Acetobacteraceae bacterium]